MLEGHFSLRPGASQREHNVFANTMFTYRMRYQVLLKPSMRGPVDIKSHSCFLVSLIRFLVHCLLQIGNADRELAY
jgi:hypothetical protein